MKFLKKFGLVALCLGSTFSHAEIERIDDPILSTPDISAVGLITTVATRVSGVHAIFITGGFPNNLDNCDLNDRAIYDETANPAGKTIIAMAMSASLAGANVRINVDGCMDINGSSGITAPKLTNIKIITE